MSVVMPTSTTSGDSGCKLAQHAFDGANTRRLASLNHRIAGDPALTGMNDAGLRAVSAGALRRRQRTQQVPQWPARQS